MKLIDVTKAFQSDEQWLAYLEKMRWPMITPMFSNNLLATMILASLHMRTAVDPEQV